jgi:acyl dehydratase
MAAEPLENDGIDPGVVPRSATGVVLCWEPCRVQGRCRLGISGERVDDEGVVHFDIECPEEHREMPEVAHGCWTASILSEMAGVTCVLRGVVAYLGTITVRFEQSVPMHTPLIGRAQVDGRERRKLFVSASLHLAETDAQLAQVSAIMIASAPDPQ